MKKLRLKDLSDVEINRLYRRPKMDFTSILSRIEPIIQAVESDGDAAVRTYTKKFDGVDVDNLFIDPACLPVTLSPEEKNALDTAMRNVQRFHREQVISDLQVETMPGITCKRLTRPVEKVGLYIPGGTAPLPSTAIMLGVPAATAGCDMIIIATPPDKNGRIPESIAYVAREIQAAGIVLAGGAQAIAAMAYGTETIPKVDKIFGPGNQYVTAAKMALQNSDAMISIDLPAGPSEVLVIADETADPEFVAADLLSQAEHGPDSQVVLLALDGFDLPGLDKALERQLENLPRGDVAKSALENSFTVMVNSTDEALHFSNNYAPEHLIINTADADSLTDKIRHAGSVFLGPYTPESLGDYASGTNHTLPTYGYAKMYSGVSLNSFQKSITFQQATPEGLKNLGPTVEKLAEMEGLEAHRNAVSIRLKKLSASMTKLSDEN